MSKMNYKLSLLCVVSALALMVISFYNGYPFYGGETHAYLDTGFTNGLAYDRPPFYGIFIRLSSLWTSLWFTVFVQCWILSWLLVRYISLFKPDMQLHIKYLCVLCIPAFSCVSWVCAFLIPDIFTGILLVALLLFLFDEKASKTTIALYILTITVAVIEHNSHFLLIILFAVLIMAYAFIRKRKPWIWKSVVMTLIGVLFYFSMCIINFSFDRGFVFSTSTQIFITAKFASNGILDLYLQDNCDKKNLKLCSCKGQLPPETYGFMWPDPSGPIAKLDIWHKCDEEFTYVNREIFTTPKYLKMVLQKSVVSTMRQMCEMQLERSYPFSKEDNKILQAKIYFEDEFKELMTSKQNTGALDITYFNLIYTLFFILSSVVVLLMYAPATNREIYLIYFCIILYFFANAYVTANFSMVCPRFQNRIFWVLPATNIILILKFIEERMNITRKHS